MVSQTLLQALSTNNVPFIPARYFTPTTGRAPIKWIVLHSMEAPDKPGTARAVARYFQTLTRPASAHYCVDGNEVVQCVQTKDVAYGAPGANRMGLHIEMAGYAAETAEQWEEPFSLQTIENAAWLAGLILLPKFPAIPIKFVNAAGLRAGELGITTHAEVTKAFNGTHTDPGAGFPIDRFLAFAQEARAHVTK